MKLKISFLFGVSALSLMLLVGCGESGGGGGRAISQPQPPLMSQMSSVQAGPGSDSYVSNGDTGDNPGNRSTNDSTTVPKSDVNFGLTPPPDTRFDAVTNNVVNPVDGLYTIRGEYAYAMNPTTFEAEGPPLDPVTHEPVQQVEAVTPVEEIPAPAQVIPEQQQQQQVPEQPAEIPEELQLPNTGIFLEDD